jgi:hypothetical protein
LASNRIETVALASLGELPAISRRGIGLESFGGRQSAQVNLPVSCVTRFDTGVIADDISSALSCVQNKLFAESDGCGEANRIRLILYILAGRSSPWARLARQVGPFVQADVYGILLQDRLACAAQIFARGRAN